MNKQFRIYAKTKKMTQWKAFDVSTGKLLDRLIYAPLFEPSVYEDVKAWIDAQHKDQDEVQFKIQPV